MVGGFRGCHCPVYCDIVLLSCPLLLSCSLFLLGFITVVSFHIFVFCAFIFVFCSLFSLPFRFELRRKTHDLKKDGHPIEDRQ